MSRFSTALVAVFLALVFAAPAFAATSGLIRGKVTVDGKPAAHATVTLQGEGSRFQATADSQGDYVFPQVPFGSYRLIAQVKGTNEIQVLVNVASGTVTRRSTFRSQPILPRSRARPLPRTPARKPTLLQSISWGRHKSKAHRSTTVSTGYSRHYPASCSSHTTSR